MERHVSDIDRAYVAPQSEILVFKLERRFMGDSVQSEFSGNYHLQSGGLGRYEEENLL